MRDAARSRENDYLWQLNRLESLGWIHALLFSRPQAAQAPIHAKRLPRDPARGRIEQKCYGACHLMRLTCGPQNIKNSSDNRLALAGAHRAA